MTPAELAEIQHELELMDPEFALALALEDTAVLAGLQAGDQLISLETTIRAEQLLDDWRYACLILERKIRPQYEALVEAMATSGEKPTKIALVTELDRDRPEHWTAAKPEAPLSLYKQIDRLAKIFFDERDIEVISKVEFVKAPEPVPGEESPRELSVLGVRVEAV